MERGNEPGPMGARKTTGSRVRAYRAPKQDMVQFGKGEHPEKKMLVE